MITRCQKCGLSQSDGAMGSVLPQCRCWLTNNPVPPTRMNNTELLNEMLLDLEQEHRLLRARNERLEKTIAAIVPRLEQAFGATHAAPLIIKKLIEENT